MDASDRILRVDWADALALDLDGVGRLSPRFVAEIGRGVVLVDVREPAELDGPLGVVPGSVNVPLEHIDEVASLPVDALIVLVCGHGGRSLAAARRLGTLGMTHVAVLDGGVAAFREDGYATLHGVALERGLRAVRAPVPSSVGVSEDTIRAHVGSRDSVRWVKLAAFLLHGRTSCVDGRDDHGVIGTPGGDMGEFVLALAAVESLGVGIDEPLLPLLLRDFVEAFGTFYLHSDVHATSRFIAALRADPRIPEDHLPGRDDPPLAWRRFLRRPDPSIQAVVLEHLLEPVHVGCGHVRLCMTESTSYGVRATLVRAIYAAYFRAAWDGLPELEFVPLGGSHEERGVLLVEADDDLWPFTRIPLVSPHVEGEQVFVHHPQVTAFQRRQIDHLLVTHPALHALAGREDELRRAHVALGAVQMEQTLSRLAKGLPIFRARFSRDRRFEVESMGHVPPGS